MDCVDSFCFLLVCFLFAFSLVTRFGLVSIIPSQLEIRASKSVKQIQTERRELITTTRNTKYSKQKEKKEKKEKKERKKERKRWTNRRRVVATFSQSDGAIVSTFSDSNVLYLLSNCDLPYLFNNYCGGRGMTRVLQTSADSSSAQ